MWMAVLTLRVETVIEYYVKWMARFPTVHELASAPDEDVNAAWAGECGGANNTGSLGPRGRIM